MCDNILCPINYGDFDCEFFIGHECKHKFVDASVTNLKQFLDIAYSLSYVDKISLGILRDLAEKVGIDEINGDDENDT